MLGRGNISSPLASSTNRQIYNYGYYNTICYITLVYVLLGKIIVDRGTACTVQFMKEPRAKEDEAKTCMLGRGNLLSPKNPG